MGLPEPLGPDAPPNLSQKLPNLLPLRRHASLLPTTELNLQTLARLAILSAIHSLLPLSTQRVLSCLS
jgi:hypothetical protein